MVVKASDISDVQPSFNDKRNFFVALSKRVVSKKKNKQADAEKCFNSCFHRIKDIEKLNICPEYSSSIRYNITDKKIIVNNYCCFF